MTRYFNEQKEFIGYEYDPDNQVVVNQSELNRFTYIYHIIKPAKYTEEIDRKAGLVKDVIKPGDEEIGEWRYASQDGYPATDYTDAEGNTYKIPLIPPADQPHEQMVIGKEFVCIVRDMTPAEKEAHEREKERQREAGEVANIQQLRLNEMLGNDADEALVDNDSATCALFEAQSANAITTTLPFSKAYMRRIIRGEITTSQVPQALQAEVEDLISQRALTLLNASVSNGLINGVASIDRSFERGISLTFIITANEGYRVPTQDEIWSKAHLSATNDSGQTIPHYAEAHTS